MSVIALPSIRKDKSTIEMLGDVLDTDVHFFPIGVDCDGCGVMQSDCWVDDEYGLPGAESFRVLYGPEIAEPPFTDECPF